MKKSLIYIFSPVILVATISFSAHAQNASVNCDTAKEDIAHLEHEKKSTDERAVKGVVSIMPIGLAINAADSMAKSGKHEEMDIKEYNEKLTQRIEEIKQACGIKQEEKTDVE